MGDFAREARPEDAPAIKALVDSAYAKWIPLIGRLPLPMQADYAMALTQHAFDLIEAEGGLVALLETFPREDHLFVVNVAVAPSAQGRGLGERLLGRAEGRAKALGLRELRLITNALYVENIRFYEKRGYEIARREPFLGGEIVHMRKFI